MKQNNMNLILIGTGIMLVIIFSYTIINIPVPDNGNKEIWVDANHTGHGGIWIKSVAFVMLNRYSYDSHNTPQVPINDEFLEEQPLLIKALEVESISTAMGLVHPIEWVNGTVAEGREIIEELGYEYLATQKQYFLRIRYNGQKFQLYINFGRTPPIIA